MMTERLLHFIWQFQYFNRSELASFNGERIEIIHPGLYNLNQGPDFSNARIAVDGTTWAGTIELHLKTSDWYRHGHQDDKNYANVILHVVWEHDADNKRIDQTIPILELRSRVAKILLERYEKMTASTAFIPCETSIGSIKDITWKSWKERVLAERLLRKAGTVLDFLQQNKHHWEETFWWLLAKNFGMKVNADTFESVARSIPLNILAKHKNQLHQLEALLLGQAGLLEKKFEEDYPLLLQKEYRFLQNKYNLQPVKLPLYALRMRPANFPELRLAELAALVNASAHLFSRIKEAGSAKELRNLFEVTANDYWHYHYQLDKTSSFKKKRTGDSIIDNIIINTVAPVLFAYGDYHRENRYKEKAVQCLEETVAEKNVLTRGFQKLGVENKNARDSQALIELKNEYCSKRKCLDCAVANAILRQ